MSITHPRTDICDYYAGVDKYGLGAGVYPKDKAPVPPFHPFCRCQMIPKYADEYSKPKLNTKADKEYLLGLKEWQRARILGSKRGANEALKTGDITGVFNAMKPQRYKVKSISEVVEFQKNTNIKAVNNLNNKAQNQQENYQPSEEIKGLIDKFKQKMVTYLEPQKLKSPLSEDEIIKKISGGDLTQGSCASVALAYLANKAGLDVRDFRGGASTAIISENIAHKIESFKGVKANDPFSTISNFRKKGQTVLSDLKEWTKDGKEVYFIAGEHAAIVRANKNNKIEYLELQSSNKNGWHEVKTQKQLVKRFGKIYDWAIVDADSLAKSDDFFAIIGYINTQKGKEMKGEGGFEK